MCESETDRQTDREKERERKREEERERERAQPRTQNFIIPGLRLRLDGGLFLLNYKDVHTHKMTNTTDTCTTISNNSNICSKNTV